MPSFHRFPKLLFTSAFLLLTLQAYSQTIFANPSFEGNQMYGVVPPGWQTDLDVCGGRSTPDTQPGFWDCYLPPHQGNSYLGLVARVDNTAEGIFQQLATPLQKGNCYSFTIHLAKAPYYEGHPDPISVEIWAGNNRCERKEILWQSPKIAHENWQAYEISFSPSAPYAYIIFLATGYRGNILIDDIAQQKITAFSTTLTGEELICEGEKIRLDASSANVDSYSWSTGETASSIEVSQPGEYSVTLRSGNCQATLLKRISMKSIPDVELGKDTTLLSDVDVYEIVPTIVGSEIFMVWNTGETAPAIKVRDSGKYWAIVSNECGTKSDSINIEFIKLFIPNVVTDNNDGLNDKFFIQGMEPGAWSVKIYNRWGDLIYEDPTYRNTWPETGATAGVYFFLLQSKNSEKIFKDYLHLITD